MQQFECRRVSLRPSSRDKGSESVGFVAPYSLVGALLKYNQRYVSASGFRRIVFSSEPLGILLDSLEKSFNTSLWEEKITDDPEEIKELFSLCDMLGIQRISPQEVNEKQYYRYYDISGLLETLDLDPVILNNSPTSHAVGWAEVERLSHFGWELLGVDDGWAYLRKPIVLEVENLLPKNDPPKEENDDKVCGDCNYFQVGVSNPKTGVVGGFCLKHKHSLNNKTEACSYFEPIKV